MSYDLTVYCPETPTIEQVLLLVGNTRGLRVDSANTNDTGVVVLRGVKRSYSFTVDGPFPVEVEDIPVEITAVLPEVTTMFQVLVEGTQEAEIPHGVRFARKLAKACHGMVLDEQTDEVWPQPRTAKVASQPEQKQEPLSVWLSWMLLEDDLPTDFLERYLQLAQELLPEAVPVRFGNYEPYQHFDSTGPEGFITEYYSSKANKWEVHYKNPSPITFGKIDGPERAWGIPFTRITLVVDGPNLADDALRSALRRFFLAVATELGAVYASAEVERGQYMPRRPFFRLPPDQWVGFPPYPLWWVWAGPRLAPEIGHFLGPTAEEHNGGVFRAFSDEPLDRDALADVLGPENLPWIPAEYSATYTDHQVAPLAVASVIPEVLRNREPLDLPPGIYNPPRKA
ncbi:hypothetical protein V3C41_07440 [Paenarthrobacter nicotinovorans]|uniref:Uncharacterized protein n=1 Tax=Paenarthrobacter nicotinovorans TaxID=29320 RepID=A0ABV0GQP0_PAENI|nr:MULTISPECIES: hypothetical protein [Micrococcaceae]BCW56730.1 hypothetical protein StoSoilB20_00770 [Arthrobacter sp. StoSoilB20]